MTHSKPLKKPHLLVTATILGTLLLLLCLMLIHIPGFSPRILALDAGLVLPPNPTCATASANQKATLCNQTDPVVGGCVSDAHTTANIVLTEDGKPIGLLERRHSVKCKTYWGRLFDYRPKKRPLTIQFHVQGMAADEFSDTELYSNMVFVPNPKDLIPQMDGLLSLDQDDPLSQKQNEIVATLPAVPASNEP